MERAEIMLPEDIKVQALKYAVKQGVSLEQFVKYAISKCLKELEQQDMTDDPFLSDHAVFTGDTPSDTAENHDAYLYEEEI